MRLIDAGKLLDELNERRTPYDVEINEIIVSQKVYDIEKIIVQLEDMKKEMENKGLYTTAIGYRQAIEIVKRWIREIQDEK